MKFSLQEIPSELAKSPGINAQELSALVWTSTPWTLPANSAIALHSDTSYAIVDASGFGQLLVAESRLPYLSKACLGASPKIIVGSIPGKLLVGHTHYTNKFRGKNSSLLPFVHADFVSETSGSGLVHCAPGHGMEDYEVCHKHGILAFAPVDENGCFTKAASPDQPSILAGKATLGEGSEAVLSYLREFDFVVNVHKYRHKYPYDWRTKLPVIVRATEQWFADVAGIKGAAMMSLETAHFVPHTGRARLESFVAGRSEWCISRQRAWGVPIPALYHKETGEALLTPESVSHIISVIEQRGIDAWWTDEANDSAWTLPQKLESDGYSMYRRGEDTMDVWFDSGTTWTQIKTTLDSGRQSLADVYCEGTDQHRGWFQSSLLTYNAHQIAQLGSNSSGIRAPFDTLVTHGFVLDSEGRKMSKSSGNVIAPKQIMDGSLLPPKKSKTKNLGEKMTGGSKPQHDGMGPDLLRLWVAGSDYTKDLMIGEDVLRGIHNNLHKLRVTIKWLLGTLADFDPKDIVEYNDLTKLDQMALLQLSNLNHKVLGFYRAYEFYRGRPGITANCTRPIY